MGAKIGCSGRNVLANSHLDEQLCQRRDRCAAWLVMETVESRGREIWGFLRSSRNCDFVVWAQPTCGKTRIVGQTEIHLIGCSELRARRSVRFSFPQRWLPVSHHCRVFASREDPRQRSIPTILYLVEAVWNTYSAHTHIHTHTQSDRNSLSIKLQD
jgi:hypothetical protein